MYHFGCQNIDCGEQYSELVSKESIRAVNRPYSFVIYTLCSGPISHRNREKCKHLRLRNHKVLPSTKHHCAVARYFKCNTSVKRSSLQLVSIESQPLVMKV